MGWGCHDLNSSCFPRPSDTCRFSVFTTLFPPPPPQSPTFLGGDEKKEHVKNQSNFPLVCHTFLFHFAGRFQKEKEWGKHGYAKRRERKWPLSKFSSPPLPFSPNSGKRSFRAPPSLSPDCTSINEVRGKLERERTEA